MNSTKILFITSEVPPQPGGIGNHAHNLALSLQKEGKQLVVISDVRSKDGKPEKEFDAQLPFQIQRIKRRRIILISYFDRFYNALKFIKTVDTVLASGKFSLWLVFFLKLIYIKKYIAIIHGSEVLLPSKIQRKFTDNSLRKFNSVIAVSNYTKSLVEGLSLKNLVVIPNGFTLPILDTKNLTHQKPTNLQLLTVGNVTLRKGQHNVVKSIPILLQKYPNLKYHIVGIPTEKEKIENLAKELNVLNHIIFHGKVSEEKKWKLMQSCSLFIMLSEATEKGEVEGFGIGLLEANSLGIPSIGAIGCGIEDAIEDGKSGILINAKQSKDVLKAVSKIEESYLEFSENAKILSRNFSWDIIVIQYLEVLDK